MKKWMIAVFWGILVLPNLIWPFALKLVKNENIEKRDLAEFPVFSRETAELYPAQMEDYINDHAAFRNQFLYLDAGIDFFLFQTSSSQDVIRGKKGWFFFKMGNSVMDYRGQNLFSQEELDAVAAKAEEVRQYYEAQGTTFMIMLAPNKEGIYPEYMPDAYTRISPVSRYDQIQQVLQEKTQVPVLLPKDTFLRDRDRQWYYKTDTHWNALGSFVAVQELIEAAGGETSSLDDMEISSQPWGDGDLIDMAHLPRGAFEDEAYEVSGFYDEVEAEVLHLYPNRYAVLTAAPDAPDKRRVTLCRDSFALPMTDYLSRYFCFVDSYHTDIIQKEYLERNHPDILVYEIVERNMNFMIEHMNKLLAE